MRLAGALILALACWAGAAETLVSLNTAHPLYSKVVAVWPFAATGTAAVDALVADPISTDYNGVAGVLPGRVDDMRGTLGYVPSFTGTEYFKCGAIGNFERTDKFTFSFLVKSTISSQTRYVVAKQNAALRGISFQTKIDSITIRISNSSSNLIQIIIPGAVPVNVWSFITVTYDGSGVAAGVKSYVNGVLKTTSTVADNLGENTIITTEEMAFGARTPSSAAIIFTGQVAFVAIFNDAITPAEALQISLNYRDMLVLDKPNSTRYMRYLINNRIFNAR